ncbi:MAG TPA: hypothetical protein VNL94_10070 [Candidatus Binatia bacterium]|nr:hypothetical protein [Candidatus Binatia bacterium]
MFKPQKETPWSNRTTCYQRLAALRTNVSKRMRRRDNALYLVFKTPSASSSAGGRSTAASR